MPAKSRWISSARRTDSEPESSHPAPESAVSTRGASAPRPTASDDPGDQRPRRRGSPTSARGARSGRRSSDAPPQAGDPAQHERGRAVPDGHVDHSLTPTTAVSTQEPGAHEHRQDHASRASRRPAIAKSARSSLHPRRMRRASRPRQALIARPPADQRPHLVELTRQAAADVLAEGEDRRVGDPVTGEVAGLLARDDPRAQQQAEVLGDVLLGGAELCGQLLDGELAIPQPVEDEDAGGLGEQRGSARR